MQTSELVSIYKFENEEIKFHTEQQMLLLEPYKVYEESHMYWHKKFMKSNSKEHEMKSLKACEHAMYAQQGIQLHYRSELEERLRVANELLRKHGISVVE